MKVFKATKKLVNGVIKTLAKLFNPAPNSKYKSRQLATTLVDLGRRKASAEEYSKPSPDRILDRLHEVDEGSFNSAIWKLNTDLLERLPLPQKVTLALDYKTLPYYGEEQPALVSDSRLPGTKLGIRFAMLSIVESGRTFVLLVKQVGPFTSKVRVVREMLDAIEGLVEPRIILLDKGFFTVEVIKELQSRKLAFLMPAKRTGPIKRLCRLFKKGEVPPITDYTIKSFGNSARVKLMFAKRKTKGGWRTFAYVSSISFKPERADKIYRRRWRIETNNRELGKFRAKTTSADMELRRMYYWLSALLYNLWMVLRHIFNSLRSREFKDILRFQLQGALATLIDTGLGPPL